MTLDLNRARDARVYLELWRDRVDVTRKGETLGHLWDLSDDDALKIASKIFRELDTRPAPPLVQ